MCEIFNYNNQIIIIKMKFYLLATLALCAQAIQIQQRGDGEAPAELGAAGAAKPEEAKAEATADAKAEAPADAKAEAPAEAKAEAKPEAAAEEKPGPNYDAIAKDLPEEVKKEEPKKEEYKRVYNDDPFVNSSGAPI